MKSAQIYIYRNLITQCWSVKYHGLVVAHTPSAFIWDATLRVNPGGRQRALREGHRNVHSYAICELEDLFLPVEATTMGEFESNFRFNCVKSLGETLGIRVSYRYDRDSSFVEVESREPVYRADHIYFTPHGGMYIQRFTETPERRPIRDRDWHGNAYT